MRQSTYAAGDIHGRFKVPQMSTFTLVVTAADGHQHVTATEFSDDASAIQDAAGVLTEEHPTIAVVRGHGGDAEFLGRGTDATVSRRGRPRNRRDLGILESIGA